MIVFFLAGVICLLGAFGVVLSRNPVHAALSLVATLFGIAVLFVQQSAHFLAAVQVIVYTGAIVVLILFVIMLLGVDQEDDLDDEPIRGQRVTAVLLGLALFLGLGAMWFVGANRDALVTGEKSETAALVPELDLPGASAADVAEITGAEADGNIQVIGNLLFTKYVFAFEATAALLTIAVVGAVVLARRPSSVEPMPIEAESLDDDFMAVVEEASLEGGH